ncbi:hypothetical protein FALBO_11646 [Fusarium albosuccineum]|uniref:Xylanolytic transcriptional activator regulatory domain-containing protein n=1 Tax=Fusarium albosuccineum TaxID=1237068 RepID=A0A8H4L1X8_9HYPO|nr:hypothetical protein FALBO_11646 [Fusarium albosuccineum]
MFSILDISLSSWEIDTRRSAGSVTPGSPSSNQSPGSRSSQSPESLSQGGSVIKSENTDNEDDQKDSPVSSPDSSLCHIIAPWPEESEPNTEPWVLLDFSNRVSIGLALGPSALNTDESHVMDRLHLQDGYWQEKLFAAARLVADQLLGLDDSGLSEDGGLWAVQVPALMSFFLLAKSKRNAADNHCAMAVRSAYKLRLHRDHETNYGANITFKEEFRVPRRNVWRSLFVLDKFLSASLGRPPAISEQICVGGSLTNPNLTPRVGGFSTGPRGASGALDAAVDACQIIGQVLDKIYSTRRIPIEVAHQMAEDLEQWSRAAQSVLTNECLHRGTVPSFNTMALVHVQLLGFYANILLCRPFFMHCFARIARDESATIKVPFQPHPQLGELSERCVSQSLQTITLIKSAVGSGHFPGLDPLALYLLFDATLIVLSNKYAHMYVYEWSGPLIKDAMFIMERWAQSNPQAKQFFSILDSFQQAVELEAQATAFSRGPGSTVKPKLQVIATHGPFQYRHPYQQAAFDHPISPWESPYASAPIYPWVAQSSGSGALDLSATGSVMPMLRDDGTPQSHSMTEGRGSSQSGEAEVDFDSQYLTWC